MAWTKVDGTLAPPTPDQLKPNKPAKPGKPGKKSLSAADKSASGIIKSMLHEFGLDGLAEWAWKRYKQTGSLDLVKMEMEDQPEYKKRFAGRLALRDQGVDMSEAEQISYEEQAHNLMRQAGMPADFYNSWQDFQGLIGGGVSVAELGQRVNDAYVKVTQAPAQVRQAMAEYYGAGSDSALAALALDQTKAAPAIMQQIAAAETGGYLAVQGIHMARGISESLAKAAGYNDAQIQQAAQQTGQWDATGIFHAQFGESNTHTVEQGAEAAFGQDQHGVHDIQRQEDQRAASAKGTDLGTAGLGQAQR